LGHSRPMHLVPVPINVRCYSDCVAKLSLRRPMNRDSVE
jgi:hypothetical protein